MIVAAVLIAVGYFAGPAVRRRAKGKRISAGKYRVEFVCDGDSLRLANGAEVRLVGIDAPDDKDHRMHYADEARVFAKKLLEGKTIRIVLATDPVDTYGRNLAYVYIEKDGKDMFVNLELVKLGYAYAWPYKPNWAHRKEILAAQKEAQEKRRGLWVYRPKKSRAYVVEMGPKFSLTHRPSCAKLKRSHKKKVDFTNRLDALNHNGGSPPCRQCKP